MFLDKKFYLCDQVKYCPIYTYLLECELMQSITHNYGIHTLIHILYLQF